MYNHDLNYIGDRLDNDYINIKKFIHTLFDEGLFQAY